MRTLERIVLSLLVMGLAFAVPARAKASALKELDGVADKLTDGIKDRPSLKVAALEFPYTSGKTSEGSVIVQERLTTLLAQNKKVTLIERSLLKKVMEELKLQVSGAMDEETVKKLGKMLGADAVVTGTLNDLKDGQTEVNARIVEAETGKILSAANAVIKKTWQETAETPNNNQNQNFGGKPLVQLAVLLDTSNSMDGLINQARNQLWKIINELISSEKSGSAPAIEVAVYEYGNSGLTRESGYIRQVLPFTTNLDKVAEELFALKTRGGDEYCGQVIRDAVTGLKWSAKDDVYRAIFIAGNEPFTQGPVDFKSSVALAKSKGIFVNTIFCGSRQEGMATQWLAGAQLADGDYANIDQSAPATAISAPQDDQLSQLSSKLNQTSVAYGDRGRAEFDKKERLESSIAGSGGSIVAERAAFKAAAPAAMAAQESSWDAVSAIESGAIKRDELKKEQLPEELKKLDRKDLDKYLDGKLAERKNIKAEITRLQGERKKYIAEQEKKQTGPATLDKAVISSVRKQAAQKGYKFKR